MAESREKNAMRLLHRVALFSCGLAIFVIVLGAFTRLVDAGLGCPDWPGCYGHVLWPNDEAEIHAANQAYPHAPVETDKTWPEMVHRYFASGLGLCAIALVTIALRNRKYLPVKHTLLILAIVILQGLFGMWTVTLKLWPQVVTAHLLGGFTTFSLLWLLVLRAGQKQWQVPRVVFNKINQMKPFAVIGLLLVVLQITLGGWTTSNYAAVACPDLPTCQGQWLPPMDFATGFNIGQHIGPNYLGGVMDNDARVAIHMAHRIGAIITALYLVFLSASFLRGATTRQVRSMSKIVLHTMVLQVVLGLSNVWFHFPLSVAVLHNLVGAILLLSLVSLCYFVFTAKLQEGE